MSFFVGRAAAVVLLSAFLLSACWTNTSPDLIYVKPIIEKIDTLDPSKTRFRPDYMLVRAIGGPLLTLDPIGEVKPGLIESWQVNKEGTEYIFNIRQGVAFHSGKPATVEDVIFTFHYLASPDSLINRLFLDIEGFEEYSAGKVGGLRGIKKINDKQMEVRLRSASFVFLVNLADPKVAVLPRSLNGKLPAEFFEHPDGVGPFKLVTLAKDRTSLVLERNENYFLGVPKLKRIRFQKMSLDEAVAAFKLGAVHDLELFTVPLKMHSELKPLSNQYSVSAYSTSFVFFNGRQPIFSNPLVRARIASAVDVGPLSQECDVPYVKSFGFIPRGILGWIDPKYGLSKNIVSPGMAPSPIPKISRVLRFLSYGDEANICVVKGIVNQLKVAGIPLRHDHVTQDEIVARLESGKYDLFFEHLSVRGSEPYHLLTYFDPRSRHNIIWFNDSVISSLGDKIKESPAKQIRASLYRQMDYYLSQEKKYFIPLFSDVRHYFFSKAVYGSTIPAMITMNTGIEEVGLEQ